MTTRLSTLGQLLSEIHARSREITEASGRGKRPLMTLLIMSFLDAMEDIKQGGEFDEFADLAILNLIVRGAEEGYSNEEIHTFIRSLQDELS